MGEDTGFALRACDGTHDPDDPGAACTAAGVCSARLSFAWSCSLDDGTLPPATTAAATAAEAAAAAAAAGSSDGIDGGASTAALADASTCGLAPPSGCEWSLGARALAPAAYRFALTVRHTVSGKAAT